MMRLTREQCRCVDRATLERCLTEDVRAATEPLRWLHAAGRLPGTPQGIEDQRVAAVQAALVPLEHLDAKPKGDRYHA